MLDTFISYARSTEAQAQAKRIANAPRGRGYGVWRNDELPAPRAYTEVVEERLQAAARSARVRRLRRGFTTRAASTRAPKATPPPIRRR